MAMQDAPAGASLIERSINVDRIPHLLGAVAVLLVGAVLVMLVGNRIPGPVMLIALGSLAAVGVAALLGFLFGVVRVGGRTTRQAVADWALGTGDGGLAITRRDGEIVFADRAYGDVIGGRGAVVTPDLGLDVIEPDMASMARVTAAAERGDAASAEVRTRDGRWLRVATAPAALSSAQTGLTSWRVRDITAERERQAAAFVTAQEAIAYLDNAPVGFVCVRSDGVIVHLNATLAEWTGTDLTAFRRQEMRLADLFGADATLLLADQSREARRFESELITADGDARPATVILGAAAENGQRLLTVAQRAAGTDHEGAGTFARFFENNPIAMASLDADGRVVRANHAFGGVLHLVRGASLLDGLRGADVTAVKRAIDAAASGTGTREPVDCLVPADGVGEMRHLRFLIHPLGGGEEAAIVAVTDNTERMEIEKAYVQAQKMEAVGQLAGGMAHDFNNVLTGITVSTDLLLDNHPDDDPSNPELRTIKTNVLRAAALVRHLLAFSKKQTMQPKLLHLTDILADADILLRNMAKHVRLVVEPAANLWHVRADRGQLDQVLTNLVKNAGDATEPGGTITIGARNVPAAEAGAMPYRSLPAEDFVMIEVTDTGCGMDAATLDRIFEPFFTTKDVNKGTGLGLAMVYGTVKQSGGFVYADSEVGKGTRFRILLPCYQPTEAEVAAVERRTQQADRKDITGTGTILLVEDENVVRAASVKALRRQGYTVHEAADGEEGLEVLEELDGEVDVIVSDVVMPEMNGPSMLRAIRARYGDRHPVVFVSGHAEDAFANDLPDEAEFRFLPKPYNLSQLAATVKDALTG